MGDRMQLDLGAQSRAARRIADQIPEIGGVLQDLATALKGASPGFRGMSAGALAEAVRAWFTVAGDLPVVLGEYATALAEVDRSVAATDSGSAEGLAQSPAGTGSGLNMGPGGPR